MTVSELKAQIFAIARAFTQTVPAEALLCQPAGQTVQIPFPAALRAQTKLNLRQLLVPE